jgi:hypothetical protein
MAGTAVDGTGTTVTFGTSTFAAQLIDVSADGRTRDALKSTHMGTTGSHTYIPADLVEGGEFSMTYFFNGTDATATLLGAAAETVTIAWITGVSWAASCFCIDIGASSKIGETMQQTVKMKVAGAITEDTTA